MPVAVALLAFLAGALVSLATSWVLVSRLERVGERLGLSEALLGIVAALAADAPEVTVAVTAIAGHQQRLGAGVVIGSNVFNLAALLGLGAAVAARIMRESPERSGAGRGQSRTIMSRHYSARQAFDEPDRLQGVDVRLAVCQPADRI
jgi:Ca2+/Na+ antiporter